MNSIFRGEKRRTGHTGEIFLLAAVHGAAYLSLFLLLGIMGYLFFRGFRGISIRFLTTATSSLRGTVGIGGNLVNTLYIIAGALLIAVPVGVGAAVYLTEYAENRMLVRMAEFSMDTLSGIPSVIFGLFGMAFFGNTLGLGYSLLSGSLTMALLVLPLIVTNAREAIRAVPKGCRSGALGLGAGRWYMIRTVLLPAAMPGVLTGITLAAGRIAGESAALLFTAGSAGMLPRLGTNPAENARVLGEKIFQPGGTLTIELYLQVQKGQFGNAFAISSVLMITVLAANFALKTAGRGRRTK